MSIGTPTQAAADLPTSGRLAMEARPHPSAANGPNSEPSATVDLMTQEAQRRLEDAGYRALRNLTIQNQEDVLILQGRVPTFYLKQLAQALIRDIDGLRGVVNRLRVD